MPAQVTGRRDEALGGALVVASAVLFGSIVVLGRFTADLGLPVPALLAVRFAVCAALLASLLLLVLRRPLLPEPGERLGHVVVGIAGYGVEAAFFFGALRHGNAAPVTLLFYTHPVIVTLASWGLGRGRPTKLTLASLALGVAGASIVVAGESELAIEPLGVVLALCSATTYAAYLLGADHVIKRTDPLPSALWVSAAAGLGLGIYAAATGGFRLPSGWELWWPILGMAVATAGAFVCLFGGLRRLGAVRTSIVSSTEPFAAALLAFGFLGEAVGLAVAFGGALIVAGAVIASLARVAPTTEPPIP